MTEPDLSTCPWCGCPERPDSILNPITCRADWACWSFQHGAEPRQSIECERNVLVKEVERLRAIVVETFKRANRHTESHDYGKGPYYYNARWEQQEQAWKDIATEAKGGK